MEEEEEVDLAIDQEDEVKQQTTLQWVLVDHFLIDCLINFTPMNFTDRGTSMTCVEGGKGTNMKGCTAIVKDNKKRQNMSKSF